MFSFLQRYFEITPTDIEMLKNAQYQPSREYYPPDESDNVFNNHGDEALKRIGIASIIAGGCIIVIIRRYPKANDKNRT